MHLGLPPRRAANPKSRFEPCTIVFDPVDAVGEGFAGPTEDFEGIPWQKVTVEFEEAKSIVTENRSPDLPFRLSVNPYRGCLHSCAYCYARPTHEYLGFGAGTDFETRLIAKRNAPALLRKWLTRRTAAAGASGGSKEPIVFSGVTDCYQGVERKLGLTRACLEACRDFDWPVNLITKSTLILRDGELLKGLAQRAAVSAVLSIPFADAEVARALEPYAPPPEARFRALSALSRLGIRTGISLAPMVPGLNDRDIPNLLQRAKDAGAAFAFYGLLRLPGSVEPVFLPRLRERLPDHAGRVEHHLRECRGGALSRSDFGTRMRGTGPMADMVRSLFHLHARRLGLGGREEDIEAWEGEAKAGPAKAAPTGLSPGQDSPAAEPASVPAPLSVPETDPAGPRPEQMDLFSP